jgi:metal-responsive CopG/Arc/MetJ family transcriptional regulator
MATTYTTVKIPDTILDKVEEIIREHPEYAYRNRSEFVIEAIREKIRSLETKRD